MSKSKKAKAAKTAPPAPKQKSVARQATLLVLAAVIGWGGGYALWKATRSAPQPAAAVSQVDPQSQVEPAAQVQPTIQSAVDNEDTSLFQKLKGKWVRPDGGYVVEVRSVDEKGRMEAIYLNPKPIKVAKAEASRDGSTIRIHLELRGENYPGSTYDLTYDPKSDQLTGVYYQAALQQRFEVTFVRMGES